MRAPNYPRWNVPPGAPRARGPGRDALRSAAFEEGSHAVGYAAENYRVVRLSVDGRGGGRCRIDHTGRPESLVGIVAGQVGARMFGEDGPQFRLRHVSDNEEISAATGGRRDLRERAEREARQILSLHKRTVRALAERLLEVGVVEGAELDRLLLPVRTEYVKQFASRGAAA